MSNRTPTSPTNPNDDRAKPRKAPEPTSTNPHAAPRNPVPVPTAPTEQGDERKNPRRDAPSERTDDRKKS